jgi:tetratricopeptide (TPR) repeat protein
MRTFAAVMLIAALLFSAGCRSRFRAAMKPPATKPAARSVPKPAGISNPSSRNKAEQKSGKEDPVLAEGLAALEKDDYDGAVDLFSQVIARNDRNAQAYYYRASAYANKDDDEKARTDVERAIELDPNHDGAYALRGWLHAQDEDYEQAIADCSKAIRLNPKSADAYATRASAYEARKEFAKAVADYKNAIRIDGDDAESHNSLAWILATCPSADLRSGSTALEHATKACRLTNYKDAVHLDTLAAACAECGKFREAIDWEQKALKAAVDLDNDEREEMRKRLEMYQQGTPYRDE